MLTGLALGNIDTMGYFLNLLLPLRHCLSRGIEESNEVRRFSQLVRQSRNMGLGRLVECTRTRYTLLLITSNHLGLQAITLFWPGRT